MNNILVTGGAGYIGSNIIELLLKEKNKIFIIDNLSTGYKKLINQKVKFYKTDINKFKNVRKIILDNKIDTVIHLAASISINESNKNPKKFYNNNVNGTKSLVEACKKSFVKNFIFSSTAAVYKDTGKKVSEKSIIKPKSIYGKTKIKAERLISKNFKKEKINYAILRYFNVVGASPSNLLGPIKKNDTLLKNLSSSFLQKKPKIHVYGRDHKTKDGSCIRDYIHVYDLRKIHILVLKKIKKNNTSIILNCGYGKGVSVLEVINGFSKFLKIKPKIIYKNKRTGDLALSISENKKLKNFIKWKPRFYLLKNIIKSCIRWEKKIN